MVTSPCVRKVKVTLGVDGDVGQATNVYINGNWNKSRRRREKNSGAQKLKFNRRTAYKM